MLKKNSYTILFISWMLFITFLSLFSFKDDSLPKVRIPHLDKAVHFTFYFIGAILGSLFTRESTKGNVGLKKTIIIVFFTMVVYGIIIEVIQLVFTPNRHGDILDVLANSLGAFSGILVIKYLFSKKSQLKWKN